MPGRPENWAARSETNFQLSISNCQLIHSVAPIDNWQSKLGNHPCSLSGSSSISSRSACWCWTSASFTVPAACVFGCAGSQRSVRSSWLRFCGAVFFWQGRQVAIEFVTGYVLELSLSVDNLFIFLVIFRYFAVPEEYQHRVLFWGILGALLMRGLFHPRRLASSQASIGCFTLFGGFLSTAESNSGFTGEHKVDPAKNPLVKAMRRLIPVTDRYRRAILRSQPARKLRPLCHAVAVVLLVIETTDLLFAIDSIPAFLRSR